MTTLNEEQHLALIDQTDEVETLLHRLAIIRRLREEIMKEGVHFGKSPGTDTPALWQAGGDILKITFKLKAIPQLIERDPEIEFPHRGYIVTTDIVNLATNQVVAEGHGSCSTLEKKHQWRWGSRICPQCKQETIRKGSDKYGGGWFCSKRDKGCGANFKAGDPAIEEQEVGRIPNQDLADLYNTVLKVAKKRAFIDGILDATGAREQFIPPPEDEDEDETPTSKPQPPRSPAKPQAKAHKFQPNQLYAGTVKTLTPVEGTKPGSLSIQTEYGELACFFRITPEAVVSVKDWKSLLGKQCSLSFLEREGPSGSLYQLVDNFEILLDENGAIA